MCAIPDTNSTMRQRRLPLVGIVILNWNKGPVTLSCTRAVQEQKYRAFRLYVVDNGSTDNSIEMLDAVARDFPDIVRINNPMNLGYAGGNNVGIKRALSDGADYVWVLNNDARPTPDTLERLVRRAEENDRAGMLGPVLIRPEEDGGNVECAGVRFWLDRADYEVTTDPTIAKAWQEQTPAQIAVWGTAPLLRRGMLQKVGLFDERLFAYFEDLDLSLRVSKAGYYSETVFEAVVYHRDREDVFGEPGIKAPYISYYCTRNETIVWFRHSPFFAAVRRAYWILHKRLVRISMLKPEQHAAVTEALLAGVWDGWLRRSGIYDPTRRAPWFCHWILLKLAGNIR
jgi:GT2 family glycosyltransferase